MHARLSELEGGRSAPEAVRRVHGELAAAAVLTPEALQHAIRAYLDEHHGRLGEDVASAIAALDAYLLGRHAILLEDLPSDVLGQFCADPDALAGEAHIGRLRRLLYAESTLPIPARPRSADGPESGGAATARRRQFVIERETLSLAVREYHAEKLKMAQEGRSATSQPGMRVWVQWVEGIARSISELRQKDFKIKGRGREARKLLRDLELDAELLGIITCQTVLNLVYLPSFRSRDDSRETDGSSVPFVTAVIAVGEAVQLESMVRSRGVPRQGGGLQAGARAPPARAAALVARKALRAGTWDKASETVPLGAVLVDLLMEHACVEVRRGEGEAPPEQGRPRTQASKAERSGAVQVKAFQHSLRWEDRKRVGYLELASHAQSRMDYQADIMPFIEPKYQPMIMEPLPWRPAATTGGYLMHQAPFIRTTSQSMTCLHAYSPRRVANIMDGLGRTAWRVSGRVLPLILEAQRRDLAVAGVPPREAPEVPLLPPEFAELPAEERETMLIRRHNAEKRRAELQSEWPTFEFKLQVARNFRSAERIHFPHNVDFRGRAYPVPPHLNHIGDDVCRGLLEFAEPRPLGREGLFWLKVSLANLMGKNKLPFEERVAYVDASREWILDVARDPLATANVDRWAHADDGPWQALARCLDLAQVWTSGDEEGYLSALPVHLDGSCNGLQHYAALGRDEMGAQAVNLLPSDRPQDVYSVVLGIVKQKVERDAKCSEEDEESKAGRTGLMARRLIGFNTLQRKVVKQTVMTICYGVTRIGAQRQVRNHLGDLIADKVPPEELSALATYLSRLVLESIDEVFEAAMKIKVWFDNVSALLNQADMPTSWISPIGLACAQPYKKQKKVRVHSNQQRISLNHGETCHVQKVKQRMGFPPNFIHSLDATHMMMVAEGCQREGLTFAGVHDSFWTHACDAPRLNRIIRSAFVELHQQPILENLYDDLRVRLGGREPPKLPQLGSLDLSGVHDSPYVFN